MKESIGTIIRTLLKVGGGWFIAKGFADEAQVEAITGAVVTIVGIVWGIVAAKRAAIDRQVLNPKEGDSISGPLALLLCAGLLVSGCKSLAPGGAYNGDKVLFEAETSIVTSYELVNTFLKWEHENRDLLSKWPDIKKSADKMRVGFPQWYRTANALRDAYASNPDSDSQARLNQSLTLLRAALNEAAIYMSTAANQTRL